MKFHAPSAIRWQLVAVAIAGALVMACSTAAPTPTATTAVLAVTPVATTATVLVKTDPTLGQILTDSAGRTLYRTAWDAKDTSNCVGGCATAWPPFAPAGTTPPTLAAGVPGTLSVMSRTGGGQQIEYNGLPLYYFVRDQKPGDTTGNNVANVWHVVKPNDLPTTPVPLPVPASPTAGGATGAVATTPVTAGTTPVVKSTPPVVAGAATPAGAATATS